MRIARSGPPCEAPAPMGLLRSRMRAAAAHLLGRPARLALLVYGALSLVTIAIALASGTSPFAVDGWLELPAGARHLVSLAGGVFLAAATVGATRVFVKRWCWAKALHADLRPAVRDLDGSTLWAMGIASGVSEELFFRGLLAPAVGILLSSAAFGLLHRLRGRSGWIWTAWATIMGLLFCALFFATGSLVGAIVAHAAINVANLRFLRDTDVEPRETGRLGSLLGEA